MVYLIFGRGKKKSGQQYGQYPQAGGYPQAGVPGPQYPQQPAPYPGQQPPVQQQAAQQTQQQQAQTKKDDGWTDASQQTTSAPPACPTCGGQSRFIAQYQKYYCDRCGKYL